MIDNIIMKEYKYNLVHHSRCENSSCMEVIDITTKYDASLYIIMNYLSDRLYDYININEVDNKMNELKDKTHVNYDIDLYNKCMKIIEHMNNHDTIYYSNYHKEHDSFVLIEKGAFGSSIINDVNEYNSINIDDL